MEKQERDEAGLAQILSGGTATLIAIALMVFGGPSQPGDRRKALFAALEDMMGYYPTCGLLIAIGLAMLGWGLLERRRARATS